ncbi:hypothetical protein [Umezawaea sp. Da 62-37]|uniref:hypothetical protein n=1 Tax=Umezawaea sp. Da 62-37 TaxID=3075927 RepID=UPI0028F70CE8|nr:hypothetical protein [Umezawaea sp. Da 62-37]WNV89735.1 hypothetical protein RM788_15960 [Umezawaea sp. Da 62-37]
MRHTNRTLIDLDALVTLFHHGIAKAHDLLHLGLPTALLHDRCRPGGPWQHLLPGILLLTPARPSRPQRIQAALTYAGDQALVTGLDALHLHGIHTIPATGPIHVLVPRHHQPDIPADLLITRTRTMPKPTLRKSFLTAPPARALSDAAHHLSPRALTPLLAEALKSGVSPTGLHTRGSPSLTAALATPPIPEQRGR